MKIMMDYDEDQEIDEGLVAILTALMILNDIIIHWQE
jgi:hypothetical protein